MGDTTIKIQMRKVSQEGYDTLKSGHGHVPHYPIRLTVGNKYLVSYNNQPPILARCQQNCPFALVVDREA